MPFVLSCAEYDVPKRESQEELLDDIEYSIIGEHPFISGYKALNEDKSINVVVEIPAGTIEKWEVEKENETMELEMIDDKPRIIKYLGYPGNYGMIPQTILPKENGGDGDPLDVLVLGPPAERGSVISCQLVGILHLLDRGEIDDKLIALSSDSSLERVNDIMDLQNNYPGTLEIIETWFENYKGVGLMESKGFSGIEKANEVLDIALASYESKINQKN